MNPRVRDIVKRLDLKPHPEGGFFRETYRSADVIEARSLPHGYSGSRSCSTCIYFLLTSETFSAFHKILQDEVWHFYEGSPIRLHTITEDGRHTEHLVGDDLDDGQTPQFVVPGGHWFAAEVSAPDSYALVGCTVAPGFDFADFTLAQREALVAKFPQHEELIAELTRAR